MEPQEQVALSALRGVAFMGSAVERGLYQKGLAWIAYERGGHNGTWPPRDPRQCCGWTCVRMLADLHDMRARDVARDLVEFYRQHEGESRQS
jgi:hypothetical protein